jgi:hypothetical protein
MAIIRESPPPSRWGKTKGGVYFYVVHVTERNHRGEKLYRLKFPEGITSSKRWTLTMLNEEGVRWLKNQPSCFKSKR